MSAQIVSKTAKICIIFLKLYLTTANIYITNARKENMSFRFAYFMHEALLGQVKTIFIVSVPQDLSKRHDWPVAKSIVRLANQVGGNSLSQLGVKNKDLSAASRRYYSRLDKVDVAG